MKFTPNEKKPKSRKIRTAVMVLCIVTAWLVILAAGFWMLVVRNVAAGITVEAGTTSVAPADFLIRKWNIPVAFASGPVNADLDVPGDHPVQILYLDRVWNSVLHVRDTVSPAAKVRDVTALSVRMPQPEEFILEFQDVTPVTVSYETEPDMSQPGEQVVSLLLTDTSGNTALLEPTLTVIFDRTAPVLEGVDDIRIYRGEEPDYEAGITISDNLDPTPVLHVDTSRVDVTQGGRYPVIYTLVDASGNSVYQTINVTVIVDEEAPRILGVQPVSLYVGSTVSYRKGIVVTDNTDDAPKLTIDSSGVDLTQPGAYQVTYTATDVVGNSTSVTTSVTVKAKTGRYVEEDEILRKADEVISVIIRDDMTDREKVETVFKWVTGNFSYYGASDKTDWMQAAYSIMKTRMGDCFNFYAVTKLLLDRLEIPNITVTRDSNPYRTSRHYWSLVSVDGGETYYHVDTTPHSYGNYRFCLVTDSYLDEYDLKILRGYYIRDYDLYPATPKEPLK